MLLNCKVYDQPKESETKFKIAIKIFTGETFYRQRTQIEGWGILGKAKKM